MTCGHITLHTYWMRTFVCSNLDLLSDSFWKEHFFLSKNRLKVIFSMYKKNSHHVLEKYIHWKKRNSHPIQHMELSRLAFIWDDSSSYSKSLEEHLPMYSPAILFKNTHFYRRKNLKNVIYVLQILTHWTSIHLVIYIYQILRYRDSC